MRAAEPNGCQAGGKLPLTTPKKLEAGFLQIAHATGGLITRECAARPDGANCRGLVDKYK